MVAASVATDRSKALCKRPGSAWIQFGESCAQDHSQDTSTPFIWGKEHCPEQGSRLQKERTSGCRYPRDEEWVLGKAAQLGSVGVCVCVCVCVCVGGGGGGGAIREVRSGIGAGDQLGFKSWLYCLPLCDFSKSLISPSLTFSMCS